jgi:hypothetical protein
MNSMRRTVDIGLKASGDALAGPGLAKHWSRELEVEPERPGV